MAVAVANDVARARGQQGGVVGAFHNVDSAELGLVRRKKVL